MVPAVYVQSVLLDNPTNWSIILMGKMITFQHANYQQVPLKKTKRKLFHSARRMRYGKA
jgi:hypothetical protein